MQRKLEYLDQVKQYLPEDKHAVARQSFNKAEYLATQARLFLDDEKEKNDALIQANVFLCQSLVELAQQDTTNNQPQNALIKLNLAVEIDHEFLATYRHRASVHYALGNTAAAEEDFKVVWQYASVDSRPHYLDAAIALIGKGVSIHEFADCFKRVWDPKRYRETAEKIIHTLLHPRTVGEVYRHVSLAEFMTFIQGALPEECQAKQAWNVLMTYDAFAPFGQPDHPENMPGHYGLTGHADFRAWLQELHVNKGYPIRMAGLFTDKLMTKGKESLDSDWNYLLLSLKLHPLIWSKFSDYLTAIHYNDQLKTLLVTRREVGEDKESKAVSESQQRASTCQASSDAAGAYRHYNAALRTMRLEKVAASLEHSTYAGLGKLASERQLVKDIKGVDLTQDFDAVLQLPAFACIKQLGVPDSYQKKVVSILVDMYLVQHGNDQRDLHMDLQVFIKKQPIALATKLQIIFLVLPHKLEQFKGVVTMDPTYRVAMQELLKQLCAERESKEELSADVCHSLFKVLTCPHPLLQFDNKFKQQLKHPSVLRQWAAKITDPALKQTVIEHMYLRRGFIGELFYRDTNAIPKTTFGMWRQRDKEMAALRSELLKSGRLMVQDMSAAELADVSRRDHDVGALFTRLSASSHLITP